MVLVVDESRSMAKEHAWIPTMIEALELSLLHRGIGIDPFKPNLYGLVGFARGASSPPYGYLAHTFTLKGFGGMESRDLFPYYELFRLIPELKTDPEGRTEDGYQAIDHALRNISFRTAYDVVRVVILITDEDRDVSIEGQGLSRESMRTLLLKNHVGLHVVVDNTFTVNGGTALGIDSKGSAILEAGQGNFVVSGAELGGGYERTRHDYTDLALEVNGTAWDLNELRKSGIELTITRAFTELIVSQIIQSGTTCKQCGYEGNPRTYKCLSTSCQVRT